MVTTIDREEAGDTTVRLKKRASGEYVVTYERPNKREVVDDETPTTRLETARRVFGDRIGAEQGFQIQAKKRGEGPRDDLKQERNKGFGLFGGSGGNSDSGGLGLF